MPEVARMDASSRRSGILKEQVNCWKIARARRIALLVDTASYYRALHTCLLRARRSIYSVGWELDPETRHLAVEREQVEESVEETQSLIRTIDLLAANERALAPLSPEYPDWIEKVAPSSSLSDAERPVDSGTIIEAVSNATAENADWARERARRV